MASKEKRIIVRTSRQINRVLKNKDQAVRQGVRRYDKRSIFKHM